MQDKELIDAILGAPMAIANAEAQVAHWKREVSRLEAAIEASENGVIASRSAKEWGSNDGERKVNQTRALLQTPVYMQLCRGLDSAKDELQLAEIDAALQRNRFYAYRSVAEYQIGAALGGSSIPTAARQATYAGL